jgi:hypothetical protein
VGGARVDGGHIWVRADIRSGREPALRSKLAMGLAQDISDITGVQLPAVWVYIANVDAQDIVEYGRVMPNRGGRRRGSRVWIRACWSGLRLSVGRRCLRSRGARWYCRP